MPRVALIGNCQIHGIGEAIRFFCPNSFVKIIYSWRTPDDYGSIAGLVEDLRSFDIVAWHPSFDGLLAGTGAEALRSEFPELIALPIIVFPAFHPDLIYLYTQSPQGDRAPVQSAIGAYNSAITVLGYIEGLSADETISLFRRDVYQLLGYMDFWPSSFQQLVKTCRESDLQLEDAIVRWARSGCFMHAINHPKIHVLVDVARALLKRASVRTINVGCENYMADNEINDAVWPVYEPIAQRYAVPHSNIFKRPDYAAAAGDGRRFFDLRSFVEQSYKSYSYFTKRSLWADRFETMNADPNLRRALLDMVTH